MRRRFSEKYPLHSLFIGLALVSVTALGGCTPSIARRFEQDTGCPAKSATAQRMSNGLYEVRGCGTMQRYVCSRQGTCVRDGVTSGSQQVVGEPAAVSSTAPAAEPPVPPAAVAEAPDLPVGIHEGQGRDGRRGLRLVVRDGQSLLVLRGVPADDTERVTLRVYSRNNVPLAGCREISMATPDDSVEVPADGKIAIARLTEMAQRTFMFRFCNRRMQMLDVQRLQVLDFVRMFHEIAEDPIDEEAASAAASASPASDGPTPFDDDQAGPGPAPTASGPEATIRAALDAKARSITTCIGGPGAIEARWTAAGAVTVSVRGEAANSPVQGCVRSAVGSLRVSAPRAGQLLHAVE